MSMSESALYSIYETNRLPQVEITPNDFGVYSQHLKITEEDVIGRYVLDIGAGASDFVARINELGGFAVATDLRYGTTPVGDLKDVVEDRFAEADKDELFSALDRFAYAMRHSRGHFIKTYTGALPFAENSFDLVTSHQLLYKHLFEIIDGEYTKQVIGELIRVTKPGGKIKDFPVPKTPLPQEDNMNQRIADWYVAFMKRQETASPDYLLSEEEKEEMKNASYYLALLDAFYNGLITMPRFYRTDKESNHWMVEVTKK